jgi:hypothetical protein
VHKKVCSGFMVKSTLDVQRILTITATIFNHDAIFGSMPAAVGMKTLRWCTDIVGRAKSVERCKPLPNILVKIPLDANISLTRQFALGNVPLAWSDACEIVELLTHTLEIMLHISFASKLLRFENWTSYEGNIFGSATDPLLIPVINIINQALAARLASVILRGQCAINNLALQNEVNLASATRAEYYGKYRPSNHCATIDLLKIMLTHAIVTLELQEAAVLRRDVQFLAQRSISSKVLVADGMRVKHKFLYFPKCRGNSNMLYTLEYKNASNVYGTGTEYRCVYVAEEHLFPLSTSASMPTPHTLLRICLNDWKVMSYECLATRAPKFLNVETSSLNDYKVGSCTYFKYLVTNYQMHCVYLPRLHDAKVECSALKGIIQRLSNIQRCKIHWVSNVRMIDQSLSAINLDMLSLLQHVQLLEETVDSDVAVNRKLKQKWHKYKMFRKVVLVQSLWRMQITRNYHLKSIACITRYKVCCDAATKIQAQFRRHRTREARNWRKYIIFIQTAFRSRRACKQTLQLEEMERLESSKS